MVVKLQVSYMFLIEVKYRVLKNVNLILIIWRAGEAANDSINVQTLASLLRNYEKTKLLLTLNSLNKTRDCVPF